MSPHDEAMTWLRQKWAELPEPKLTWEEWLKEAGIEPNLYALDIGLTNAPSGTITSPFSIDMMQNDQLYDRPNDRTLRIVGPVLAVVGRRRRRSRAQKKARAA